MGEPKSASENQIDLLASLAEQRRLLQISEWEYETAKQKLIDPLAQERRVRLRNIKAAFIVGIAVVVGVSAFAFVRPQEFKTSAIFAKEFAADWNKNSYRSSIERFREFEDNTDAMVDGWFNGDQLTRKSTP